MWATRKNGTIDSFNLFYVNRKWKGLATLHTQLYRRLHGRQTRIFRFSSTMRGGKLEIAALPPFSSAVKLTFQFSSARRGGKLEIAYMMRVHMAEIFQSDFVSFLPFLCLLVGRGSGLRSTKRRMGMCE